MILASHAGQSAPCRVQRHALVVADKSRRFQHLAARTGRHWLPVPFLHRHLVSWRQAPIPRSRRCRAGTPLLAPRPRGWHWAARSISCPAVRPAALADPRRARANRLSGAGTTGCRRPVMGCRREPRCRRDWPGPGCAAIPAGLTRQGR